MTISGINGASTGALDLEGQLALLVLTSEEAQQSADRELAALERDRLQAASDEEVAALKDSASHALVGAILRGGCQVASAATQFLDATSSPGVGKDGKELYEAPYCEATAAAFSGLAEPLAAFFGDSPAQNDKADAKRAETKAQLAQSDMAEAKAAIDESQERQDKALDWLSAQSASSASTESAIIAGFA